MHRLALFCLGTMLLAGCRVQGPQTAPIGYQLKGTVMASDAAKGEVLINGQAIPGFMEGMTMAYKLAQPGIAGELHPGDRLTARLQIVGSTSTLDQIVVVAQAKPDYKPLRLYNTPQTGQKVPNFELLNQDGKTISIGQFHGKVLLVTFIYTRCPLPDYCIRMSRNFATIQKEVAASPQLAQRTQLLSISFDPAYDTAKVLRSYGDSYTRSFANWDFAAAQAAQLDSLEEFFDVGVSAGSKQTITHSLSTAVIGPDGRIFRWYPNNDWDPAALVRDIQQALVETPEPAAAAH